MNYNIIRKMDISDGPGVRISVFFQGCAFHCKNCFNSETWDFEGGKPYGEEEIKKVIELARPNYVAGLSLLGGEPMHPLNIENTLKTVKAFRAAYPEKTIWMWSGYLYEQLKGNEVLSYIDVLVDGQYVDELHDFRLHWKGSSNQRVIDMKKTLQTGEIVLYED